MQLHIGQTVLYKGKPVYITAGSYFEHSGISNYWYWRTIRKDGTLGKQFSDYNNKGLFKEYTGTVTLKIILHSPNYLKG